MQSQLQRVRVARPRTIGNLRSIHRAPTPLASHNLAKSLDNPSDKSIIAVASRFSPSHCPNSTRGSG